MNLTQFVKPFFFNFDNYFKKYDNASPPFHFGDRTEAEQDPKGLNPEEHRF